jgi:hypothetical protein
LHEKHTNEARKENFGSQQNEVVYTRKFMLKMGGINGCYETLGNNNYKNLHVWNAKNA